MDEKETLQICRGIAGPSYITCNNGVYLVNRKQPSRIGKWFRQGVASALIAASALSMPAVTYADEKPQVTQTDPPKRLELKGIEEYVREHEGEFTTANKEANIEGKVDKSKGWFLVFGTDSYFSGLKDSEKEIKMIEDAGKIVFHDWKKLHTFSDMRDIGMLADLYVGVGRDLGKNWDAFLDVGGGYGAIKNHNRYGLIGTHFDFSRFEAFAELSLEYFPLGKTNASFTETGVFKRIIEGVHQAKPFAALTGGYSYQGAGFHAQFQGPFDNKLFGIRQNEKFGVWYVVPRIGVDIPVTKSIDYQLSGGVLIPNDKKEELGGPMLLSGFRVRF